MKLVLEGAELGMWEWDLKSDHLTVNDRWANILGFSLEEITASWATGESWSIQTTWKRITDAYNQHVEGDQDFYQIEYRMRSKTGEWVWVSDKGRIVQRDLNGNPTLALRNDASISITENYMKKPSAMPTLNFRFTRRNWNSGLNN